MTPEAVTTEKRAFLESELITYIGNKRNLIPFIAQGVEQVKAALGQEKLTFLDMFAGSGVVSRFMKAHASHITCNDVERYAAIVNSAYLSNTGSVNYKTLEEQLEHLNRAIKADPRRGFIAELYAPKDDDDIQPDERVFYTRRNAEYIDSAREHLEGLAEPGRCLFLANLLVKASIHTNTAGVFKGFYKNRRGIGAFGGEGAHALTRIRGEIGVQIPTLSAYECGVTIMQKDAVTFADTRSEFDLVYLDPPYNQHPYGSNYFMLNLIAEYECPALISKVSGIPQDWRRSPFNKAGSAAEALFSIVRTLRARYFLISYNSEGFITKEAFVSGLQQLGRLTTLENEYNTYRGSRNLRGRDPYVTEYLFLLEKR